MNSPKRMRQKVQPRELPPSGRGMYPRKPKKDQAKIAEVLRNNPLEWQLVMKGDTVAAATGFAAAARHGRYLAFRPGGQYEATCRGTDVWMRYVP